VVLGAFADEIKQQVRFARERVILNPDFTSGMSSSLQAGLRAISGDAALIALADQPFVRPETIDLLIAEYERRRSPSVVIPTYNGARGNPVIVDQSLFPEIMNIRGDLGCRAIFADHARSIVKLPVDDRGVLTDIDRPEDLEGRRPE
jgi:molybdenum cofactor cytidylyltransferase